MKKLLYDKKGFDPAGLISLVIMVSVMVAVLLLLGLFAKAGKSEVEVEIIPLRNELNYVRDLRVFLESPVRYGGKNYQVAELISEYNSKDKYLQRERDEATLILKELDEVAKTYFKYENFIFSITKDNKNILYGSSIISRRDKCSTLIGKSDDYISTQIIPLYNLEENEFIYVHLVVMTNVVCQNTAQSVNIK